MLSKILKTTALVALEVLLDDLSEDAKKRDKFIDEHNDGAGNVNFVGDDYSEQAARDAHDRGEFYY